MTLSNAQSILGLEEPPISIAFLDQPPAGVERWQAGAVPAGCVFWRSALSGKTFYTVPSDHYNCAVGAHTHGIAQPEDRSQALPETVGFMVAQGYIEMAEVPSIPTLSKAPNYIAYGPVDTAPFDADVVLIAAKPSAAMLLYEIAVRAGAAKAVTGVLGRPACAVLPSTQSSESTALSLGCKGNRVFTGLPDEKMYVAIPGKHWTAVVAQASAIEASNATMEKHYREHKSAFPILS